MWRRHCCWKGRVSGQQPPPLLTWVNSKTGVLRRLHLGRCHLCAGVRCQPGGREDRSAPFIWLTTCPILSLALCAKPGDHVYRQERRPGQDHGTPEWMDSSWGLSSVLSCQAACEGGTPPWCLPWELGVCPVVCPVVQVLLVLGEPLVGRMRSGQGEGVVRAHPAEGWQGLRTGEPHV